MSTAISISVKRRFYEKVILSLLSKMQYGTLELVMPSGEVINLGDGHGNIHASITIKEYSFFKRCVLYGDIGFGEGYVAGEWETDDITNVIKWFLLNIENAPSVSGSKSKIFGLNVLKFINKLIHLRKSNTVDGSKENIAAHYDLNNDFFALFLDSTMTYSSAYFKEEGLSLQEAQLKKYDRLCKKLKLKSSDHVLEIGTGWGGNAIYIARNYDCKVTTVTISEEQYKLAAERVAAENLKHKITVLLSDYRSIEGKFDKIVSIEMLEAVGDKFLDVYFKKCDELLKHDGLIALQVITCPDSRYDQLRKGVDWIQKHIFPGSLLPSVAAINKSINNTSDLTLVDLKDIGLDYAKTLSVWREQFNAKLNEIKNMGFDETFIRKWNYYLCYCEAAFAMRNINTMQLVYSRPNNRNW
ncbi:MAG TPA: cyclopropane-fatty-acyl-phospholipid synthase family protein [Bacteroidia bacterium]|nr:cyclopropane-fatty-acyl-phospholipid synthase family protein [Bacteroidia bacterium]HRG52053.1 cyclopropane-fatty-acyl-phospholipid synthase family protein [Bacteroidia bacterium]